jgi:hypothetical protein
MVTKGWSGANDAFNTGLAGKNALNNALSNAPNDFAYADLTDSQNNSTNVANGLNAGSAVAKATVKTFTGPLSSCMIEARSIRLALGLGLSKLMNSSSPQLNKPTAPNPMPPPTQPFMYMGPNVPNPPNQLGH